MKKINVLEFIPDMGTGGAQALVRDYARLIDYDKFNLYIVTTYPEKAGANVELIKQTKAKMLSIYPAHRLPYQIINNIMPKYAISRKLLEMIRSLNIDVIHTHLGILRDIVPVRKQIRNVKLVYTCHSKPECFFCGQNTPEFKAAKQLIRDNNLQLIGLHEEMRQELNAMFGIENTTVIHNGVDFNRLMNVSESKEQKRESLGIPKDAFVLGHIGRFDNVKNHTFLVKVFKEVLSRDSSAFLLLVGSGPLEQDIMNEIHTLRLQDRVLHLTNRPDIPELLKAMDVFVFPSLFEGLPVTLVEAQVSGLRCVVSDNISEECFFNSNLIAKSISDSAESWADVVLDSDAKSDYNKDISVFDMQKEMRNLEAVYAGIS